MPLQVVFRPQAEAEVSEACQWYETRRAGLGREFVRAVDSLVRRIATNPATFPCVHNETRRAVLSRFPNALYFRVAKDAVAVLAIHGRQHPTHWQRRS